MRFADELSRVLPSDLPNREKVIEKSAKHLQLVLHANEVMNLTRITNAREAAVKHVFDSVAPWGCFRGAKRILDAGTGAGFPGIPLALVLPEVKFTLTESIRKKAHFVDSAVETLQLANVHVQADRAELRALAQKHDAITARAVAPLRKILNMFEKAMRQGTELILYKGPEIEKEITEVRSMRVKAEIVMRYELPDDMGSRSIVRLRFQP